MRAVSIGVAEPRGAGGSLRDRAPAPPAAHQQRYFELSIGVRRRQGLRRPAESLVFLYEPGKQVASAVKIKNVSRCPVAFKFQTTAPKSCFMCPPNGVIAPNDTIVAKVVKYVEVPETQQQRPKKPKDKFRIVSLKVKEGVEYTPELFDEQRDSAAVERVLRVVFIDPRTATPAELERQQKSLAEADAAQEARKKPLNDRSHKGGAVQGFVIDEWKERREKYLAKQQSEAHDSF